MISFNIVHTKDSVLDILIRLDKHPQPVHLRSGQLEVLVESHSGYPEYRRECKDPAYPFCPARIPRITKNRIILLAIAHKNSFYSS